MSRSYHFLRCAVYRRPYTGSEQSAPHSHSQSLGVLGSSHLQRECNRKRGFMSRNSSKRPMKRVEKKLFCISPALHLKGKTKGRPSPLFSGWLPSVLHRTEIPETKTRRRKWLFPKRECRSDRVKMRPSSTGTSSSHLNQRPTCVICGLIASVHCRKLPPEEEGDDSSQGSAERR